MREIRNEKNETFYWKEEQFVWKRATIQNWFLNRRRMRKNCSGWRGQATATVAI